MRFKSIVLGGAAIMGLLGASSWAPAMAFTRHPGTPEEHQQTEDLNAQQLANATQTGAQVTAQNQAPQAATTGQAPAAPVSLDTIANAPQTLSNASVESSSGQAVGAVQRVILDAGGKAQTVVISLLGKVNKLVSIAADQLGYDQSRNVVVAQLDVDQIQALPATPQA